MIEKLYRRPGHTIVSATQRLWRTVDNRIVEDGDPGAAFLLCNPGQVMTLAEAEKYGLYGGDEPKISEPETKPVNPAKRKLAEAETKPIWPAESSRR